MVALIECVRAAQGMLLHQRPWQCWMSCRASHGAVGQTRRVTAAGLLVSSVSSEHSQETHCTAQYRISRGRTVRRRPQPVSRHRTVQDNLPQ